MPRFGNAQLWQSVKRNFNYYLSTPLFYPCILGILAVPCYFFLHVVPKCKHPVYLRLHCFVTVCPKIDVDTRYRGVQEVKRGGMLVLPVHFTGSPRPSVTWYHRGVPVSSRPGHIHVDYGDGYSTLSVSGIESGEGDRYEVVVENTAGTAQLDFDVVVRCKLFVSFITCAHAASRYCVWRRLSVCLCVCPSAQNIENY